PFDDNPPKRTKLPSHIYSSNILQSHSHNDGSHGNKSHKHKANMNQKVLNGFASPKNGRKMSCENKTNPCPKSDRNSFHDFICLANLNKEGQNISNDQSNDKFAYISTYLP